MQASAPSIFHLTCKASPFSSTETSSPSSARRAPEGRVSTKKHACTTARCAPQMPVDQRKGGIHASGGSGRLTQIAGLHVFVEQMNVTDIACSVLPQHVGAIKAAVIPNRLPASRPVIIQSHHSRCRSLAEILFEPPAAFRQSLNPDFPHLLQAVEQFRLHTKPVLYLFPRKRVLLPGLHIGERQTRIVSHSPQTIPPILSNRRTPYTPVPSRPPAG